MSAPVRPDFVVLQDSTYLANMIVARTRAGLVVFDNTMFRDVTRAFVDSATRTLGDDRIALLINSHGHDDHTWGNQVFAQRGVPIAAHPATIEYMRRRIGEMRTFFERGPVAVAASRDSLVGADAATATRLRERIERVAENLRRHGDLTVTPPSVAIANDTSFLIGGTPVILLSFGAAHSGGDVALVLPAQGIAAVGDLIGSNELPGVSNDGNLDGWIAALGRIETAARAHGIRRIIPGRGPEATLATVACNRDYLVGVREWLAGPRAPTLDQARAAARCGLRLDSARHARNLATAAELRRR